MTLSELLEGKFRADIRFRGVAYVKNERVSITRVTPDYVLAVVRDGGEYETQLSREEDALKMYCNCTNGNPAEVTCKHLWATILSVDEGGYVSGSLKSDYIPPFACESTSLAFDMDDWDDDSDEEFLAAISRKTVRSQPDTATVTRKASKAQLRPWEQKLSDLRATMDVAQPAAPKAGRDREIFYEIDLEQSREVGQIVIQTSQRERRANGQWGKLKPLKLRPGRYDDLDCDEDIRILAYLAGGTPERTNWFAQQSQLQTAMHRYRVPFGLCELILPMMCESRRVRFMDTPLKHSSELTWDDGSPYELTLSVTGGKKEKEWKLEGRLHRDGESIPLSDAELVVPGGIAIIGSQFSRLHDFNAFEWTQLVKGGGSFTIPFDEGKELVDSLLDMPALPRLDLPKELRLKEVSVTPSKRLTLTTPRSARWNIDRLQGQVQFEYDGTLVSASSTRWAIVQRDEGRCLIRDRKAEEAAWSELQSEGCRRLIDHRRGQYDVDISARDLGRAVRALVEKGWEVHADGHKMRQAGDIQFRVQSGIDWFELHGEVDFDGRKLAFPELLSALSRKDGTVRLDDGSLGVLPEEWMQQFGLLSGMGVLDDDHVRFSASQVALLDALLAAQENVELDDVFIDRRQRFKDFAGVVPEAEPEGFKGELRAYQRDGLGWLKFLQEFHFGGCLADDMGLGKTIQVLAMVVDRLRNHNVDSPTLIVVPKSLMFNWRQEAGRFAPELKVLEYTGLDRAALREDFDKQNIILTTYGTLRRDVLFLKDTAFDYIVLDEAQTIKNAGSQVAKASRLLQANHRLALSGTPIENHFGDLWSIFEFLNPGMLGRSSVFKNFTNDVEDKETHNLLANGLRPFILRRTKSEVASELPEKTEQTFYCDMGKQQLRLYNEMRDHYRDSILGLVQDQGLSKSKMHVLEALLRLRQAACHPALLDKGSEDESSAKLDVLIPHLSEIIGEGHKALVFSQFTSMLSITKRHLDREGMTYEYLDGKTRDRQERVERFQNDPDCRLFLISLKAGGLGLNLTAADYVFLLDPWWNPAVETQAIDRAHRVGQTRQVFAYRLICRGTVEEKIAELQEKKRSLADAILDGNKSVMKNLTTEDLELLLS